MGAGLEGLYSMGRMQPIRRADGYDINFFFGIK